MLLRRIHLQNFRNIKFAALAFSGRSQFLLGLNGQGKTNLLEGISLLTALRSFRTQEVRHLIEHGSSEAQVFYDIEDAREGAMEVVLKIRAKEKELYLNEARVNKFSDFIGEIPIVVLSSEDMQLLRSAPALRRRFLDLTLSAMDPGYFDDLRRYHRGLLERNALFRQGVAAMAMVEAYNAVLAPLAFSIYQKRVKGVETLGRLLVEAYVSMVEEEEEPELIYSADCELSSSEDFLKLLSEGLERDRIFKATQRGVHRDDLEFRLKTKVARQYGSEGQQRGLVVALRLAQVRYFKECSGSQPIILADDVLGQLDPIRSRAFWKTVGLEYQVIATGTTLPSEASGRDWQVFNVRAGAFHLEEGYV